MTSYVLLKCVILIVVIHINIILPSTSRSYKWFFPSGFPNRNPVNVYFLPPPVRHTPPYHPLLHRKTQPSIKCLFLPLGTLPKQRQTHFKRAMAQGFTTVQTYCTDLPTLRMAAIGPKRRYLFTEVHGVVCRKTITGSNL